jgi:GntR family transcriptional regulator
LDIIINNSSGLPIYEQIYNQLKSLIVTGKLKEGDALPSMRLLAKELRISVITTKRAYEELERDGLIETITGKGSFVGKQNIEVIREEYLKETENYLNKAIESARHADMSLDDLTDLLKMLYELE